MKKTFGILLVLFVAMTANAQVTWNLKGGVGMASCISSGDAGNSKLKFVAKFGGGLETPIIQSLSFMPSLEVAWKGGKYNIYDGDATLNLIYLQIPAVFAYRVNVNDRLNMTMKAGPYAAFAVSGNMKQDYTYGGLAYHYDVNIFDEGENGVAKAAKRFDVGIDVGLDFELHRFVLGLEYELGFISFAPNDASLKNQAFYATIGYKF